MKIAKWKQSAKVKTFLGQSVLNTLLFLLASTMILPFIYIIMVSFTDESVYEAGKFILWPEKWSIQGYLYILRGPGFFNALKSSLFITIVGTPINVFTSAGVGYMLSRKTLPFRGFLNKFVMFTMLFSAGIIPGYINIFKLGLLDSWFACILPFACGAWTVMIMKTFFQSLPEELEEAAIIDGCSPGRIFLQIVIPLSKAMIATFTLFAMVSYWNAYFSAVLYITSTDKLPLQVFLQKIVLAADYADFVDLSIEEAKLVPEEVGKMTAIIISIIPVLCVYPFLQKHFAKGVMVGSVKG